MAVLEVNLLWEGETGNSEETGLREYTEIWQVITDDPSDHAAIVGGDPRLPRRFSAYRGDPTAFAQRVRPRRTREPVIWKVTIDYSNEITDDDEDPTNKPAEVRWESAEILRTVIKDRDGNPILTKAGSFFDPPPEDDDATLVALVRMYVPAMPTWFKPYRKAINSDSFTIDGMPVEVGEAKIQRLSLSEWQEENDVRFRVLDMAIEINEAGWGIELLEQDFYEIHNGKRRQIKRNGQPVSTPVPLDAAGKAIADPTPDNVLYTEFDVKKELPFSELNLPV